MDRFQRFISVGIVFTMFVIATEAKACTSFMLKTKQGLFFVHSLNQGNVPNVQGNIYINQRNVWKQGYSWENLIEMENEVTPNLIWRSKFGSVTFNPFGKELIDGGMNEAGLYIWEMNFDTQYPDDPHKPKLFQCQWMQYVLDNFESTEEVIENASQMSIDGWGWHYFVADKSGNTAIIDFIDGKPVIYSGDSMPVPMCCNSSYPTAMKWLNQHQGFGGELPIEKRYQEIPRFIHGARLLKDYRDEDPVAYSFNMLEEMSKNVRWSVVIDVNQMTVYFNTNLNKEIRHFTLSIADFEREDGLLMMDIDTPGPGDVRPQLSSYSRALDRKPIYSFFELVFSIPEFKKTIVQDRELSIDDVVQNVMIKMTDLDPSGVSEIKGDWVGTIKYPSSDGYMELPADLSLFHRAGDWSGVLNDGTVIKNLSISNIRQSGGLLNFAIKIPESGDVAYCQLHLSQDGFKGAIELWTQSKNALITLKRKS